jgi:FixJ family two-component response regulator
MIRYHPSIGDAQSELAQSNIITGFARSAESVPVTQRTSSSQNSAISQRSTVLVVDDDTSVREGLSSLFQSVGLDVRLFASASELLRQKLPETPCCLVLDIRLPGLSGLDFQAQLAESNIHIPIIMVTGHGDIPMTVRAMKAGAVDFLTKPFREQEILDAVARAIERDRERRESERAVSELRRLFETLTAREREIMIRVTAGLLNKQVGAELGLSEITVKIHRGRVMRKMGARSLADLVRAAETLELRSSPGRSAPINQ